MPWQGRATVAARRARPATAPSESLELAVSAAASVVAAAGRGGDLVRLVTTDGTDSGFGTGPAHLDGDPRAPGRAVEPRRRHASAARACPSGRRAAAPSSPSSAIARRPTSTRPAPAWPAARRRSPSSPSRDRAWARRHGASPADRAGRPAARRLAPALEPGHGRRRRDRRRGRREPGAAGPGAPRRRAPSSPRAGRRRSALVAMSRWPPCSAWPGCSPTARSSARSCWRSPSATACAMACRRRLGRPAGHRPRCRPSAWPCSSRGWSSRHVSPRHPRGRHVLARRRRRPPRRLGPVQHVVAPDPGDPGFLLGAVLGAWISAFVADWAAFRARRHGRGHRPRRSPCSCSPPLLGADRHRLSVGRAVPGLGARCSSLAAPTRPPAAGPATGWPAAPAPASRRCSRSGLRLAGVALVAGPRRRPGPARRRRHGPPRLARPQHGAPAAPGRRSARWSTSAAGWSTSPTSRCSPSPPPRPHLLAAHLARPLRRRASGRSPASYRPAGGRAARRRPRRQLGATRPSHQEFAISALVVDLAARPPSGPAASTAGRRRPLRPRRRPASSPTTATSDGLTYTVDVVAAPARRRRARRRGRARADPTARPATWPCRRPARPDPPTSAQQVARRRGHRRTPRPWPCRTGSATNFTYDLNVPAGHGGRAIERFLFDTKRGYCEQFAGTYAAMARIARAARPGGRRASPRATRPRPTASTTCTGKHAHAWPEVYFAAARLGRLRADARAGALPGGRGLHRRARGSQADAAPPARPRPSPTTPPRRPRPTTPATTPRRDVAPAPAGAAPAPRPSAGSPGSSSSASLVLAVVLLASARRAPGHGAGAAGGAGRGGRHAADRVLVAWVEAAEDDGRCRPGPASATRPGPSTPAGSAPGRATGRRGRCAPRWPTTPRPQLRRPDGVGRRRSARAAEPRPPASPPTVRAAGRPGRARSATPSTLDRCDRARPGHRSRWPRPATACDRTAAAEPVPAAAAGSLLALEALAQPLAGVAEVLRWPGRSSTRGDLLPARPCPSCAGCARRRRRRPA